MNPDEQWQALAQSMASGQPVVALTRDQGVLAGWRRMAVDSGHYWLEGDSQTQVQPFPMWHALSRAGDEGGNLTRRLEEGPASGRDVDNPLLPDAAGTYDAIGRWVRRLARKRPTILVCHGHRATIDCLAALRFVTRSLDSDPVAFVLLADPESSDSPWAKVIADLQQEVGVLIVDGDGNTAAAPASDEKPASLEFGIALCRSGALYTGARMLAETLSSRSLELTPVMRRAEAWQALAMAGLQLHADDLALSAARNVLKLPVPVRQRRLARRTSMLVLHQSANRARLEKFSGACERDLARPAMSKRTAAWLNLDLALITSFNVAGNHAMFLDRVLAMPTRQVSLSCLAVACVWRGAAHILRGELDLALACQQNGLALLDKIEEFTRALHVRSRVGAMLAAVGRSADAVPVLKRATCDAISAGEYTLAAINASEAAAAAVAAGAVTAARNAAMLSGWKTKRVWASPLAQVLRSRVEGQIALAEHRPERASKLLTEVCEGALALADGEYATWKIRLLCEAFYLQSDIARSKNEPYEALLKRGLDLTAEAAAEERAILVAHGVRRLAKSHESAESHRA
jgi:hypothetical protein